MGVGDSFLRIQGLSRGLATTPRFFQLYNHFTTYHPMFALHDNSYTSSRGHGSISRSDSFTHIPGSPGIASDYPSTSSMVAWAEKPHEQWLTTDLAYCDASQDDRLWMLSCAGVRAGEDRTGQDRTGDLGTPKSSGIFSIWASWIGQRTTSLLHTLSNLFGTLRL